jgi:RNA polymerase sigma-70 factor (ECF subfamily)
MGFFPDIAPLPEATTAQLRELYGFAPRFLRAQALLPEIVEKQSNLLAVLLDDQVLTRAETERAMLAASAARGSEYGVTLHEQMLKVLGVAEAEIASIVSDDAPASAIARFARKLATEGHRIEAGDVDRLRAAGLSENQVVGVVIAVGCCAFLNTVQFGTGVSPDFPVRRLSRPAGEQKPTNISHPAAPVTQQTVVETNLAADPDAEWVGRVQGGEVEAFATLVERHTQRVYRTLVGILGDPEQARDAMQDTFLKAFQNLPQFERRAKFSTWLVSIANNTGLQRLRDRKQMESLDDAGDENEEFRPRQIRAWTEDPEQLYSLSQRRELVERAISRLPAMYRVVLILRDVQQMSTEEAAAALGLGVPALKTRLLRGRLMLREALAPHFMEDAAR